MDRRPAADDDPGLFGPGSVTWRIHGDPSMALGGLRALLLQTVHPLAMAGFEATTMIRDDPWGRLQRTGAWLAAITYGTTAEAETAGARLRRVHAMLPPIVDPGSGLTHRLDDPELLLWVHCTLIESLLSTYRRCGGELGVDDGDRYVAEMVTAARLVGLDPGIVPDTEQAVAEYYKRTRPQLRVTTAARRNALWGFAPAMPLWVRTVTPARPLWAALVATAAGMLPPWARRLYGLPGLPTTDAAATLTGRALRGTVSALPEQWITSPARRAAVARLSA
jgi:uncharacterized protein (DUF2236 family)